MMDLTTLALEELVAQVESQQIVRRKRLERRVHVADLRSLPGLFGAAGLRARVQAKYSNSSISMTQYYPGETSPVPWVGSVVLDESPPRLSNGDEQTMLRRVR